MNLKPNTYCLGECKCGKCSYEDRQCGWILDRYCKDSSGVKDPDYEANECESCPVFKKICGITCNFCPALALGPTTTTSTTTTTTTVNRGNL